MNQEKPYIISSMMTDDRRNYYDKYKNGEVRLRDIPVRCLSGRLVVLAIEREPNNLIELLLDLSEQEKIKIDLLKYFKMVSYVQMKQEYYDRFFKLNPVVNYLRMSVSRRTMEMAYELIKLDPKNIEHLIEKHKTKEICDSVFAFDMNLFVHIPSEHITKEMCEKAIAYNSDLVLSVPNEYVTEDMYLLYVKNCAKSVIVNISEAIERRYDSLNTLYISFLYNIPREYINQTVFDEIFNINPSLFVAFPDKYKTYDMCEKIYALYGDRMVYFIPKKFLCGITYKSDLVGKTLEEIQEVYYNIFAEDPLDRINYIPLEYRTQKVYDLLFATGGVRVINKIPNEYRNRDMWNCAVFQSEGLKILEEIPKEFISFDMCSYLYIKFGTSALDFVPDKFLTREMVIDLIDIDISMNLKRLSVDLLDEEILSMIVIRLKKIINKGKIIDANSDVIKFIVDLYPYLIKAFNKNEINKIIIQELYLIMVNEGTVENIANKYGLGVSYVNGVLESIKDTDLNAYDTIKSILDMNQNRWFFNMQNDVSNLDVIISLLDIGKDNKLDIMQKVKFAYLYLKNVGNSLEEIYNFNYNKYTNRDYSKVDSFFKRILKYNYIFGSGKVITTMPESKTIKFNNSWLREYDRNKFFAIRDGKATMERRYGADSRILTLDIEKEVIDELKINGIPLNDTIVQVAFREYFRGNLDDYIKLFREYDVEFENAKKQRGRR